jgi:DNA-binding IclR family transcriptional regulator
MTIRQQGYAFDREEHEIGIICIAVPILSARNEALAGLSITLSTRQFELPDLKGFKPDLEETAKEISKVAGDWLLNY